MAIRRGYAKQTITTKYAGPTNTRGSRITAVSSGGAARVSVPYDHALDAFDNHRIAAEKLMHKLGWDGEMVGGADAKSGYVFVFVD